MSIFYETRREYDLTNFSEQNLTSSPYDLFQLWLDELIQAKVVADPTAMILATVDAAHKPYQRTVLMKSFDDRGMVFFTNQQSRKGQHLAINPNANAIFPWLAMERQVAINGVVEKLSAQENDDYFYSRPRESQAAAVASEQSQQVDSRTSLEAKYQHILAQYPAQNIPRPAHWGGYRLKVDEFEFWQGGEFRLHDRFIYHLQQGEWQVKRYQP